MNNKKLYLCIQVLSVIGIFLAIYLLWEQLTHAASSICSINSVVNCDAIISGAVSKTFGIPTPLYGLVGYIVILLASILRWNKLLIGMALFGLVFCLWIAYQEIFQLHVICPICIACQLIMIAVFTLSLYTKRDR